MIVCHARRFIFFHNPKCAGMSFRAALAPFHDDAESFWGIRAAPYFRNAIDHSHLRLWEMQALFPRIVDRAGSYESLIFVRNPYRRFVSALNEHIKKFQPKIALPLMPPAQRVAVAEQFVTKVLHISRITTDWRFVHFSPQLWFLRFGDRVVPRHIVPMGEDSRFLAAGARCLGVTELAPSWINPSPANLAEVLDSPVVIRFIEAFYADDFAFFRAEPALATLAVRPRWAVSGAALGSDGVITIYHNPACGTSRKVLGMLRASGREVRVIEYLKTPPSRSELAGLLARLGVAPRALLRRRGTPYEALQLDDPTLSDDALIDALLAHPILLERPIVVGSVAAAICRPPERVLSLL